MFGSIGAVRNRLSFRSNLSKLIGDLQSNYGLSLVAAKTLAQEIKETLNENHKLQPGQILWTTVASDEPPGKPIKECKKVNVVLTLYDPDEDLKTNSTQKLREIRVHRLTTEAFAQGGLLTVEELAHILSTSESSIKRALQSLRKEKKFCPTRGSRHDIGRGTSHKALVIRYLLEGMAPTKIAHMIHHRLSSVERYIEGFYRVVIAHKEGLSVSEIARLTGHTRRLVREYLKLIGKYKGTEVFRDLLKTFGKRGAQ